MLTNIPDFEKAREVEKQLAKEKKKRRNGK